MTGVNVVFTGLFSLDVGTKFEASNDMPVLAVMPGEGLEPTCELLSFVSKTPDAPNVSSR